MTSWSYSAYSAALRCLRYYKLCYVDKLVSGGPESSDLLFGSALHSAINAVLTGEDGQALFEIYWTSYKDKDVEYGRYKWADLAAIGAEFIRKFVKLHADRYKLEFAEQRLHAEYKGVRFEGTLDFLGEFDGKRSLRDFKTSGRNYEPAKADCSLQLNLYAYLVTQNGMRAPETLGYTVFNKALGTTQQLTWDYDEGVMLGMLDDLVAYCSSMPTAQEPHPRNPNACLDYNRKCQYFDVCHPKERSE